MKKSKSISTYKMNTLEKYVNIWPGTTKETEKYNSWCDAVMNLWVDILSNSFIIKLGKKWGGKCFKMQIAIYGFKDVFSYCKPC